MNRLLSILLLAIFLFGNLPALAGVELLTEAEFRQLAQELAPKVNLFRDAWEKDPKAEFYGGTSRDYFYWLKGKFRDAKSKEEAEKIAKELRKRSTIDIREFIIGESDVDVISPEKIKLDPAFYGIRKIDSHGADYFDPATETWANELNQGHIPAEKIRLGKDGIIPIPELGDGVKEIYNGRLSIHFADPKKFAATKYAKEHLNHPILLALRYLRLQAMNYYQAHGAGLPDPNLLFSGMDEATRVTVKKVVDDSLLKGVLKPYLQQDSFKSWINGTIQKSFLSYTNQTAALEILKAFDVDQLSVVYPEVDGINQYVFQQYRDPAEIEANLKKYGVNKETFFRPRSHFFPDGFLYHGTRTENAFRSILFQGALNSIWGSAGVGLYGVSEKDKDFSINWGGDKDRLLKFPVDADAKIVDLHEGEGKRIFSKFNGDFEAFAKAFGVDILKYPYEGSNEAFVVKNGAKLGRAQGVHRELLQFNELVERLRQTKSAEEKVGLLRLNFLSQKDAEILHGDFPTLSAEIFDWLKNQDGNTIEAADQSALFNVIKKEVYRYFAEGSPAAMKSVMSVIRPFTVESLKILLDAPDSLDHAIKAELGKIFTPDIKEDLVKHTVFPDREFTQLFDHPNAARLASVLDNYLQVGPLARQMHFAPKFASPHMKVFEDQMIRLIKNSHSNAQDEIAEHVFFTRAVLNYPRAFEAWVKGAQRQTNFDYWIGRILGAPHVLESDAHLKILAEGIAHSHPEELGKLFYSLPTEKLETLVPIALKNIPVNQQGKFLTRLFFSRANHPAEDKIVWDAWLNTPPEAQHHWVDLVMRRLRYATPARRREHYERLIPEDNAEAFQKALRYHLAGFEEQRDSELWEILKRRMNKTYLSTVLLSFGNFIPGRPQREILEMAVEQFPNNLNSWVRPFHLTGINLPDDNELLLKVVLDASEFYPKVIESELSSPKAKKSEEVALAILRRIDNNSSTLTEEFAELLKKEHTKNWTEAQLLYLEKAYGWKFPENLRPLLEWDEAKAKIRAAVTNQKMGFRTKIFLEREFPADGNIPAKGVKGYLLDCIAGFGKF